MGVKGEEEMKSIRIHRLFSYIKSKNNNKIKMTFTQLRLAFYKMVSFHLGLLAWM